VGANKIKMAREDQNYIIDLCDEVLMMTALREYTFDFLRGDPYKKNPKGRQLPVDAFYPSLNLVIEFEESHHTQPIIFFDKPEVMTISGISRAEQRIKYIELRKEILPKHKIKLIFIAFDEFKLKGKRLNRIKEKDIEIIKKKLKSI
jgi:hypothetical protein